MEKLTFTEVSIDYISKVMEDGPGPQKTKAEKMILAFLKAGVECAEVRGNLYASAATAKDAINQRCILNYGRSYHAKPFKYYPVVARSRGERLFMKVLTIDNINAVLNEADVPSRFENRAQYHTAVISHYESFCEKMGWGKEYKPTEGEK